MGTSHNLPQAAAPHAAEEDVEEVNEEMEEWREEVQAYRRQLVEKQQRQRAEEQRHREAEKGRSKWGQLQAATVAPSDTTTLMITRTNDIRCGRLAPE